MHIEKSKSRLGESLQTREPIYSTHKLHVGVGGASEGGDHTTRGTSATTTTNKQNYNSLCVTLNKKSS